MVESLHLTAAWEAPVSGVQPMPVGSVLHPSTHRHIRWHVTSAIYLL